MENARKNHYVKNEIARQAKPRKRSNKDKKKDTKGYGDCQNPDMTGNALEVAKKIVMDELHFNQVNREMILENTFGQKYNLKWFEACRKVVSCSFFGKILNARSPKTYTNLLNELLYSRGEFSNTAELRHQRLYETEALKMFSLVHKKRMLQQTGLFIDKELSFLG